MQLFLVAITCELIKQDDFIQVLAKDLRAALGFEVDGEVAESIPRGLVVRFRKQLLIHHVCKLFHNGIHLLLLLVLEQREQGNVFTKDSRDAALHAIRLGEDDHRQAARRSFLVIHLQWSHMPVQCGNLGQARAL